MSWCVVACCPSHERVLTVAFCVSVQVLAATPFSDESHTGEAIACKTAEALKRGGVVGLAQDQVFAAVSDNAANMLLGFANYGSAGCAVHSMQL